MSSMDQVFRVPTQIKERRIELGWTRGKLAQKADVGIATIDRAETKGVTTTFETLVKIVMALGGTVSINFDDIENGE